MTRRAARTLVRAPDPCPVAFSAVLLVLACAAPAAAQQEGPPRTAEQIEAARQAIAAQDQARVPRPEEIEALRELLLDEQSARDAVGYPGQAPRSLESRTVSAVSPGPGRPYTTIPLRLHDGVVTSVAFFSETGPWPVETVSADLERVAVQGEGCSEAMLGQLQGSGNIVTLMPCQFSTRTSAQVLLAGEDRPITLDLAAGSRDPEPVADGSVTVVVSSDVPPPLGLDRAGRLDNDWVMPRSRAFTIDPVDRSAGGVTELSLATGVITEVSLLDADQTPWPIDEIVFPAGIVAVNGTCGAREDGMSTVELAGETSTFYAVPCIDGSATIAVKPQGKAAALSLRTTAAREGRAQPDATVSVVVPGVSPATPAVTPAAAVAPQPRQALGSAATGFTPDRLLDDFLLGTPPQGSRRARLGGAGGLAEGWFYDGALYLRGPFRVMNPAHDAQASQGDSLFVWKYAPPVSRILAVDLFGREFAMTVN